MNTFFSNSIDANTFDTSFKLVLPDAMRILVTYFFFTMDISKKGTDILMSFQKIIICESAGIFWGAEASRIPAFFIFKKGAGCQHLIPGRSPVLGRTAFLLSHTIIPWLKKGAGEMEVKSEESKPSKF